MYKTLLIICLLLTNGYLYTQTVPNFVPLNGLVAWYDFENNYNDNGPNNLNGVDINTTFGQGVRGPSSYACVFNGIDSRVQVSDNNLLDVKSITISGWFNNIKKPLNVTDLAQSLVAKWYYEINCESNSDAYTTLLIYSQNIVKLLGAVPNYNLVNGAIQSNVSVSQNQWHHFVFVHDENVGGKLYLDCKLVGTNFITGAICNSDNNLIIGADNRFGQIWRHFSGSIDEVGIWNRALNECEINQLCSLNPLKIENISPNFICKESQTELYLELNQNIQFDSIIWYFNNKNYKTQQLKLTLDNLDNIIGDQQICVKIYHNGCLLDSLCNQITFLNAERQNLDVTICEGEKFMGITESGIYNFSKASAFGCDTLVTLNLKVINKDQVLLDTLKACKGDTIKGMVFYTSGSIKESLKNINGCDSIVTIPILINSLQFSNSDTVVCSQNFKIPAKYDNLIWENNEVNLTKIISKSGAYIVNFYDDNQCLIIDTFKINLKNNNLTLANIFSPNNDNINDNFFLSNSTFNENQFIKCKIYDRWGNQVFSVYENIVNNVLWDGNFNNKPCAEGVYVAIIEILNEGCPNTIFKQSITIIR